jgi:DMSO reductase anchor subunit
VTLPAEIPADIDRVDRHQVRPEHPHWPLVFMLTLTQMAVGGIGGIWALAPGLDPARLAPAAVLALAAAFVSLGASTLHLGRPAHAYRAVRAWRRSWLSREVLALALFAKLGAVYAAALFFDWPVAGYLGAAAVAAGIAGVTCSARIYMVPARPAWNSTHTLADFYLTGLLLGLVFVRAAGLLPASAPLVLAACAHLLNQAWKVVGLALSGGFEGRASATLLFRRLRRPVLIRTALLLAGGVALPIASGSTWSAVLALLLALAGEIAGRWLFFVSVVPKSIAATFARSGRAA